jgi:hypothetical protein
MLRKELRKILIRVETVRLEAEIFDTQTADVVWEALLLKGEVNSWEEEIYFSIPVQLDEENDAKSVVEVGDLGFWPAGCAFYIFLGLLH